MTTDTQTLSADSPIAATDPQTWRLIQAEQERQENTLELIASENHASASVIAAMGTCLTNKYAEGYPGARYYGGCQFHDQIEDLARDRAKKMFGCKFANVQPHSGANANAAAFMAMCKPGDTVLSMPLDSGGHLSHGMKINFSGLFYNIVSYRLDAETETIDYDYVRSQALEHKPKMIICGYSAYPRKIDFAKFRAIADEVGAYLLADVAHIAGLIVGGQHESPFPHAQVVTTTTHKTLRGPRGGLILTDDEDLAKLIDRRVFPGLQGGPLMHVIAAKAVAFGEALDPSFKNYAKQIVTNAQALATALTDKGYRLISGGTDNHLMLVDLQPKGDEVTGAAAERWLESAGIITNKNGIPNDPRPPKVTSGLRLGTPAVTTRGLGEAQMPQIAEWIDRVLVSHGDDEVVNAVRSEIVDLCKQYLMPH